MLPPAVKDTAISTGSLKEAARIHNVSYNAVKQKAYREKWPVGPRALKLAEAAVAHANDQVRKSIRRAEGRNIIPKTTSTALAEIIVEKHGEYRLDMATTVASAAKHASTLPPSVQLKEARKLDSLASAGGKIFGTPDGQSQRVSIFSIPQLKRVDPHDIIDI